MSPETLPRFDNDDAIGADVRLRLMTFNIAGGKVGPVRNHGSSTTIDGLIEVIRSNAPDVVVLQEATDWQFADGTWGSVTNDIAAACGFEHCYFGPTLTLRDHMHVSKTMMVEALFEGLRDWRQGNAILTHHRFVHWSEPARPGSARSVPIFRTPQYEGDRNTEPRDAVVARVAVGRMSPFVIGVHLTTLTGERGDADLERRSLAQSLRTIQTGRIVELLRQHVLQSTDAVALLMGDFNAERSEACISKVLEGEGFVVLEREGATHRGLPQPIDHILVYPGHRLVDSRSWLATTADSDHHAVIVEVTLR